jgi:hypothetical protein
MLRKIGYWFAIAGLATVFGWYFEAALEAQQQMGAFTTPQMNTNLYIGQPGGFYPTIQSGITKACSMTGARVVIPAAAAPSDTIAAVTGGCTTGFITDERGGRQNSYTWNGSQYTIQTDFPRLSTPNTFTNAQTMPALQLTSGGGHLILSSTGDSQAIVNFTDTTAIRPVVGHVAVWINDAAGGGYGLADGGASGGMVFPPAGIPVSTGSAWATSFAAPSSPLVGISDTQTLTNKTVNGVTPIIFGFLDPTSSVQTQLDTKVQTIGVGTNAGVSGSSSGGANPVLTFTLGAITPTSVSATGIVSSAVSSTTIGGKLLVIADGTTQSSFTQNGSAINASVPSWTNNSAVLEAGGDGTATGADLYLDAFGPGKSIVSQVNRVTVGIMNGTSMTYKVPIFSSSSSTGVGGEFILQNGTAQSQIFQEGSSPAIAAWPGFSSVFEAGVGTAGPLVLSTAASGENILFTPNHTLAMTVSPTGVDVPGILSVNGVAVPRQSTTNTWSQKNTFTNEVDVTNGPIQGWNITPGTINGFSASNAFMVSIDASGGTMFIGSALTGSGRISLSGTSMTGATTGGPTWSITNNGGIGSFSSHTGTGAATISLGPAAGTGATLGGTAGCATVCDSVSGRLIFTAGTAPPTTGSLVTVTFPFTRTNIPNCVTGNAINENTGLTLVPVGDPGNNTSSMTLNAMGTALIANNQYQISYWCGGK